MAVIDLKRLSAFAEAHATVSCARERGVGMHVSELKNGTVKAVRNSRQKAAAEGITVSTRRGTLVESLKYLMRT